jgi:hypothetical protein
MTAKGSITTHRSGERFGRPWYRGLLIANFAMTLRCSKALANQVSNRISPWAQHTAHHLARGETRSLKRMHQVHRPSIPLQRLADDLDRRLAPRALLLGLALGHLDDVDLEPVANLNVAFGRACVIDLRLNLSTRSTAHQ